MSQTIGQLLGRPTVYRTIEEKKKRNAQIKAKYYKENREKLAVRYKNSVKNNITVRNMILYNHAPQYGIKILKTKNGDARIIYKSYTGNIENDLKKIKYWDSKTDSYYYEDENGDKEEIKEPEIVNEQKGTRHVSEEKVVDDQKKE